MPRPKRFDLPGIPQHVVQRGHNRQDVFYSPGDRREYLDLLTVGASRYSLQVHAYCLMTNHVHLLVTPGEEGAIGRTSQHLGRHYVPYINCVRGRTGTLWEGRYRASIVESESYLLSCYRYIELNPVRAGLVSDPMDYPWSSHRVNGGAEASDLVVAHPLFLALGESVEARTCAYRSFVGAGPDPNHDSRIRKALAHNHYLGDEDFRLALERLTRRRVSPACRGRPPRTGDSPADPAREDG